MEKDFSKHTVYGNFCSMDNRAFPIDCETLAALQKAGLDVFTVLQNNDAYHALEAVDGLIKTGPTGTNVNDLAVLLIG